MISRRDLLRMGALSAGSMGLRQLGLMSARAQAVNDYRALVCVFLAGGNDSNNLLVPQDEARYRAYLSLRGGLALKGKQLTPPVFTRNGNAPYAFHAALPELAQMFSNGQLAVIANVGTLVQPLTAATYQARTAAIPLNLFSHVHQQLQWQTSMANIDSPSGWAGRAADKLAGRNMSNFPVSVSAAGNCVFGTGLQSQPVCLSPGQSLAVPAITGSGTSAQESAIQTLLGLDSSDPLMAQSNRVIANLLSTGQTLSSALSQAKPLHTVFPANPLGNQLQQVAQVIQARGSLGANRQIFFCSLEGFDTHAAQLETQSMLYTQLSRALGSFYSALCEMGVQNDVVTFTASEFSRTFQPTSLGDGSDHGWGGHQLVLGGSVAGGEVYGSLPQFELGGLDDTSDGRGRWIPSIAVDQYAGTLCSWLGIEGAELPTVLPNLKNYPSKSPAFLS